MSVLVSAYLGIHFLEPDPGERSTYIGARVRGRQKRRRAVRRAHDCNDRFHIPAARG